MADLLDQLTTALAGRYAIERELGRGGMATVFLAADLRHHRKVAIKVLAPEVAAAVGPERFLREIETIASLAHPHILPLFDSGDANGLLFYVMPFVTGESLRDRLAREKQLPLEDALRIAREVADALNCAHHRGVVHRDIKPENVLLQEGRALVADFGVARTIASGAPRLTTTGVTIGTPAYMSPEQAAGGTVDARTDVYGLGCLLYEMLAGQTPFTGPTAESVIFQHLNAAPPRVSAARPGVTAALDLVIAKALAKSPADRYDSTVRLVDALATLESETARAVDRPGTRQRFRAIGLVAVAAVTTIFLSMHGTWESKPVRAPARGRAEVAVLPFQNLSAGGPNAYFAGGLHEELLTQLAKVAALKTISRTSVMGYANTTKPLKQIAAELGVGSIVEGSVQVLGNRLRVNVQLIDATTDEHLWADRYDRTLDDAFAIQSDLAQQIVAAVGAALADVEHARITAAPTANGEAYRFYLQGRDYLLRAGYLQKNYETAQRLYERALTLDPNFALAHAALSEVHGRMFWWKYDPTTGRVLRQREEAEKALRIAPHLAQSHMAMGLAYYFGQLDFRRALDEMAIAQQGLPNDAEIWGWIGYLHRRRGNWDEALAAFGKATRLSPRDPNLFWNLGGHTYRLMRRYSDAVRSYGYALALAPDLQGIAQSRAWAYVCWHGDIDTLRTAIGSAPSSAELAAGAGVPPLFFTLLLWERDPEHLLAELQRARTPVFAGPGYFVPRALYTAWAQQMRGADAAAHAAFDSALAVLDSAVEELPSDWRVHWARGLALAGLGRRNEALREAAWLEQTTTLHNDAFDGPNFAEARAQILAQAGETSAALDEIERLLAGPSWLSVHTLRLDPRWDPIRHDPRFQRLLVKYANPDQWAVR